MTSGPAARGYEPFYETFDTPLMRRLRAEAYGEDIGQHSWVTAAELAEDIPRLALARASRLLDIGCGPCGPLTFVVRHFGCRATGLDLSAAALAAGRARAAALGVERSIELLKADLNEPMPLPDRSFDAAVSLDVVVHVRDRAALFKDTARVLVPGGRFLFTDAGVITGPVSDEEIRLRSVHGYTQFAPSGCNEALLQASGLRLVDVRDRTAGLLDNAKGRLRARLAHRAELEPLEGDGFERQLRYLETVIGLAEKRAVSRMAYLAGRA